MTTNPLRLLLGGIVLIFTVGCLGMAGLNFAKLLQMDVQDMTSVNPYDLSPGDQVRLMMSRRAELNYLTEVQIIGGEKCASIDVMADSQVLDDDPFRRDYDKLVGDMKSRLTACGAVARYASEQAAEKTEKPAPITDDVTPDATPAETESQQPNPNPLMNIRTAVAIQPTLDECAEHPELRAQGCFDPMHPAPTPTPTAPSKPSPDDPINSLPAPTTPTAPTTPRVSQ